MKSRPNTFRRQALQNILRGKPVDTAPVFELVRSGSGAQPVPGLPAESEGRSGEERSGSPVIYLNSNISTEDSENPLPDLNKLTPYHKKSAFTVSDNVKRFIEEHGIENCAFLTLTFKENVIDPKEASRRFDSLNTHFLSRFYGLWYSTRERQIRGAWHYHIIIVCKGDIRTGFDWNEYDAWLTDRESGKKRRLLTGNKLIRSLWQLNFNSVKNYGFGIPHLCPIKSTSEAVGKYVSKYIAKQIGQRAEEDKGVRLTSHSQAFLASSPKFSWFTDGGRLWRNNLALFAQLSCHCRNFEEFSKKAGPKWAYKYKKIIIEYQDHMKVRYPEEAPF